MTKIVKIPDLTPRPYQLDFFKAMDSGYKRAVLVMHRRAGKEIICWNYMIREACCGRVGTYCYFFPTSRLGRRILWDGANKDGKRFIDYIPKGLIEGQPNSVEMRITLKSGSVIQIMGTDQIINVGINPIGVVFSEASLQDEKAWTFIRPILRENEGWAVFNGTPRGRNWFYDLFVMAQNNDDWFAQKLTINDTGVLTDEDMDVERREGMSEHMIQQEYYVNFDQGQEGAYYAKYLQKAEQQGRVTRVPYDPYAEVDTYWDIGVSDATTIIFAQKVGNEIHIIDTYTNQGEGLDHYARVLKAKTAENLWQYGTHYGPHDLKVRELGHGAKTRLEMAHELGIDFELVPKLSIQEGIEMARAMWHKLWIDSENNKFFIKCLENYHKTFNERLNVYSDRPCHDWSSHYCFVAGTEISTPSGVADISLLRAGDYVLTPFGKRKIIGTYTKLVSKIRRIETDGPSLQCTDGHKFFSGDTLVSSDALRYNDLLYQEGDSKWNTSSYHGENLRFREMFLSQETSGQSFLMDTSIDGMGSTTDEQSHLKIRTAPSKGGFGRSILEKYLKIITSTISTAIQKIIGLKTLIVSTEANTSAITCCQKIGGNSQEKPLERLWNARRCGTHLQKEEPGINNMQKTQDLGKNNLSQWCVCSAETIILDQHTTKNTAQMPASLSIDTTHGSMMRKEHAASASPLLRAIDMLKKRRVVKNVEIDLGSSAVTVYDIEVEGDHCYFANGILVSNCDAFRYMAVAQNQESSSSQMTAEDADLLEKTYRMRY